MSGDSSLETRRKEAAAWFSRMNQRRVSSEDIQAFFQWRRDPRNAEAFETIESVWSAAETLARDPDVIAATGEATARRTAPARAQARLSLAFRPVAAGLSAAVLIAGGLAWYTTRPTEFATAVGERRTVRLKDGSEVILDTASRISVRPRWGRREVSLDAGQALFDVAHDPDRPFIVTAGDVRVTALGTRFDVRRSGHGARVTLVEGRVAVDVRGRQPGQWTLEPNQQLLTTRVNAVPARTDATRAVSWASGRIIFDGTPLRAAVAEVNRYTTRPIRLEAEAIASEPVSGAFDTGDVDGFVAAVRDLYGVEVNSSENGAIVLRAPVTKKSPNPV